MQFSSLLAAVLPPDIKPKPLKWRDSECLIKVKGFVAHEHVHRLTQSAGLSRVNNENLLRFLIEMTPVYLTFRYNVWPALFTKVNSDRMEDLRYLQEDDEASSPTVQQIAQINHEEWKHHINKNSGLKNFHSFFCNLLYFLLLLSIFLLFSMNT